MRTVHYPKPNIRVPRQLIWWEALSAICIFGTILVANVYALSWLPQWPAVSILGATLISLFCLVVGPVKTWGVEVWRIVRLLRDFEDGGEAYITSILCQLDDIQRELEELKREMEHSRSKVYARKLTTRPT